MFGSGYIVFTVRCRPKVYHIFDVSSVQGPAAARIRYLSKYAPLPVEHWISLFNPEYSCFVPVITLAIIFNRPSVAKVDLQTASSFII